MRYVRKAALFRAWRDRVLRWQAKGMACRRADGLRLGTVLHAWHAEARRTAGKAAAQLLADGHRRRAVLQHCWQALWQLAAWWVRAARHGCSTGCCLGRPARVRTVQLPPHIFMWPSIACVGVIAVKLPP